MRVSLSGDPCAITNYCMNSYLVLQVTTAYTSKLVAFKEADWLRLVWDRLALSSDWLRVGRASCCLALVRLLHTIPQNLPQCLFMCRERWSDLEGFVSKKSLRSSFERIQI